MKFYRPVIFSVILGFANLSAAMNLPAGELQTIAAKIYQNECGSNPENLVHWNQNESFASLGIGHFIWFSEETTQTDLRFEEQFPEFVRFAQQQQGLPSGLDWLTGKAPWHSRQEFLAAQNTKSFQTLLAWLQSTQVLQAQFIWQRFEQRAAIIFTKNVLKSSEVVQIFQQMSQTPQTRFALMDYVNFKGWGDNAKERYRNQGWGLLQVLEQMQSRKPLTEDVLQRFVDAAKFVLDQRIKNAPASKNEAAWRKGWFHRVEGYQRAEIFSK